MDSLENIVKPCLKKNLMTTCLWLAKVEGVKVACVPEEPHQVIAYTRFPLLELTLTAFTIP
jgi:hypothetical protein